MKSKDECRQQARFTWQRFLADSAAVSRATAHLASEVAQVPGLILAYAPTKGEFDVLAALSFPLYLPRTRSEAAMDFLRAESRETLVPGRFGILEPGPENPRLPGPPGPEDFVIVPTLAVNKGRFRLGKGGGYYDRQRQFLARAVKAAVIPFELLEMQFEAFAHDMQIDLLITERGVFR